jgi:tRNA modification GTPase
MRSYSEPTTVSRLTSSAPSAIAVLEIDGPLALDFANRCWRPNRGDQVLQLDAIRYGFTRSDCNHSGESIVVCRTGDCRVEIHCHGGRIASETILRTLLSFGAIEQSTTQSRAAEDFDLIGSEARDDLRLATTQRTTAILLDQLRGVLKRELAEIQSLRSLGNTDKAKERLVQLESRSELGRHLIEPWRVVLAGPPNSGKSSLLNLLLGYSRAIVHAQAGTTRDLLSERSSFDGWPIELVDGAGIRTATDAIEAAGIEGTLQRIASADCTLLLMDGSTGWTETHAQILNHCTAKVVFVVTKCDLPDAEHSELNDGLNAISRSNPDWVYTSSVTGLGMNELMKKVVSVLVPTPVVAGDAVPFRQRHCDIIGRWLFEINDSQIS